MKQAHPKYGNILASSSYDARVLIWRDQPPTGWTRVAEFTHHTASVNIVAWAPHEAGCLLACASSDGRVSVLEFQEGNWSHMVFDAHIGGANAVSWAPAAPAGGIVSSKPMELPGGMQQGRRFVSGGSDCNVQIWDWR